MMSDAVMNIVSNFAKINIEMFCNQVATVSVKNLRTGSPLMMFHASDSGVLPLEFLRVENSINIIAQDAESDTPDLYVLRPFLQLVINDESVVLYQTMFDNEAHYIALKE